MSETLYRRRPEPKPGKFVWNPVSLAEMGRMVFARERCTAPDQPRHHASYYCHNEDCEVRQFEVGLTYFGGKAPKLKCPRCGQPAEVTGYLREVIYEPVD